MDIGWSCQLRPEVWKMIRAFCLQLSIDYSTTFTSGLLRENYLSFSKGVRQNDHEGTATEVLVWPCAVQLLYVRDTA